MLIVPMTLSPHGKYFLLFLDKLLKEISLASSGSLGSLFTSYFQKKSLHSVFKMENRNA